MSHKGFQKAFCSCSLYRDRLFTLRSWHVRILNPTLPVQVREAIKGQVLDKIEKGKRAMRLDLIPKNKAGQVVTDINTPVATLFKDFRSLKMEKKKRAGQEQASVMANMIRRVQTRLATPSADASGASAASAASSEAAPTQCAGLLVTMTALMTGIGEPLQVAFQLFRKGEFISDAFWVWLDAK